VLKFGLAFGYAFASLRLLKKHRRLSLHQYSDTSAINLEWVDKLIYLALLITGLALVFYALSVAVPGLSIRLTNVFSYLCITGYLYFAFVKGIAQKPIMQLEQAPALATVPERTEEFGKIKYQRSTLHKDASEGILLRMEEAMQSKKLYLEPEFTLPMLAEAVQAPSYHLSQVLSERIQKNFYEYINAYRVEEAKRMLLDPTKKHYTVLAIAYDSGFNSKTTFNKVFKRFTGQTPTEFVASQTTAGAIA